ncbi:MAG: hypothetical protein K9M44_00720 [Candidatus Pacebacteria bacterium]|nr:hypothetical protein [Candidatus Paceibacterota bacterium]
MKKQNLTFDSIFSAFVFVCMLFFSVSAWINVTLEVVKANVWEITALVIVNLITIALVFKTFQLWRRWIKK